MTLRAVSEAHHILEGPPIGGASPSVGPTQEGTRLSELISEPCSFERNFRGKKLKFLLDIPKFIGGLLIKFSKWYLPYKHVSAAGSAVRYAMWGGNKNLNDIDIILELSSSYLSPEGIKELVLTFMEEYWGIVRRERGDGTFFSGPEFEALFIPRGDKDFSPHFFANRASEDQWFLEALGAYVGTQPESGSVNITFPCYFNGEQRNVDLSIVWLPETSCRSSADAFRCNLEPFIDESGWDSPLVFMVGGYDEQESKELFAKGQFIVKDPQKVRGDLDCYIHLLTFGFIPQKPSNETDFLDAFKRKRASFYSSGKFKKDIKQYLEKHFRHQKSQILFICNYLTVIESAPSDFPNKELILKDLKSLLSSVAGISTEEIEERRMLVFWESNELKDRLDTMPGGPRYRAGIFTKEDLRQGSFLRPPWDRTLAYLLQKEEGDADPSVRQMIRKKIADGDCSAESPLIKLVQLICREKFDPKAFAKALLNLDEPLEPQQQETLEQLLSLYAPDYKINLDPFLINLVKVQKGGWLSVRSGIFLNEIGSNRMTMDHLLEWLSLLSKSSEWNEVRRKIIEKIVDSDHFAELSDQKILELNKSCEDARLQLKICQLLLQRGNAPDSIVQQFLLQASTPQVIAALSHLQPKKILDYLETKKKMPAEWFSLLQASIREKKFSPEQTLKLLASIKTQKEVKEILNTYLLLAQTEPAFCKAKGASFLSHPVLKESKEPLENLWSLLCEVASVRDQEGDSDLKLYAADYLLRGGQERLTKLIHALLEKPPSIAWIDAFLALKKVFLSQENCPAFDRVRKCLETTGELDFAEALILDADRSPWFEPVKQWVMNHLESKRPYFRLMEILLESAPSEFLKLALKELQKKDGENIQQWLSLAQRALDKTPLVPATVQLWQQAVSIDLLTFNELWERACKPEAKFSAAQKLDLLVFCLAQETFKIEPAQGFLKELFAPSSSAKILAKAFKLLQDFSPLRTVLAEENRETLISTLEGWIDSGNSILLEVSKEIILGVFQSKTRSDQKSFMEWLLRKSSQKEELIKITVDYFVDLYPSFDQNEIVIAIKSIVESLNRTKILDKKIIDSDLVGALRLLVASFVEDCDNPLFAVYLMESLAMYPACVEHGHFPTDILVLLIAHTLKQHECLDLDRLVFMLTFFISLLSKIFDDDAKIAQPIVALIHLGSERLKKECNKELTMKFIHSLPDRFKIFNGLIYFSLLEANQKEIVTDAWANLHEYGILFQPIQLISLIRALENSLQNGFLEGHLPTYAFLTVQNIANETTSFWKPEEFLPVITEFHETSIRLYHLLLQHVDAEMPVLTRADRRLLGASGEIMSAKQILSLAFTHHLEFYKFLFSNGFPDMRSRLKALFDIGVEARIKDWVPTF